MVVSAHYAICTFAQRGARNFPVFIALQLNCIWRRRTSEKLCRWLSVIYASGTRRDWSFKSQFESRKLCPSRNVWRHLLNSSTFSSRRPQKLALESCKNRISLRVRRKQALAFRTKTADEENSLLTPMETKRRSCATIRQSSRFNWTWRKKPDETSLLNCYL